VTPEGTTGRESAAKAAGGCAGEWPGGGVGPEVPLAIKGRGGAVSNAGLHGWRGGVGSAVPLAMKGQGGAVSNAGLYGWRGGVGPGAPLAVKGRGAAGRAWRGLLQ